MVDSWYFLDRVVPERMSQVWRRSEVRNHKRSSLKTRLSSGISANTSCTSRNAPGRMIRSDLFLYGNNLKIKPTYREKNLPDYLFGEFRSTLKRFLFFDFRRGWNNRRLTAASGRIFGKKLNKHKIYQANWALTTRRKLVLWLSWVFATVTQDSALKEKKERKQKS